MLCFAAYNFSLSVSARNRANWTMGRRSKFSLPSLGHSEVSCVNTAQMTSISSPYSPTFNSISKAEEILGPSETGGGSTQSKGLTACLGTARLKKKLSALSIKIMNPECDRARSHKASFDEKPAKVSSPRARPAANGSVTSFTGGSLHTYRSSSMLRSDYDPESSPRAASQQQAASKAQDMAIRKGYSPVASPLRQTVFRDFAAPVGRKSHGAKKEPELEQRRPTHIDFSTLLRKPQSPNDVSLSRYDTIASPSLLAASDIEPPHSPSRRTWLRRKISTATSQPKSPSRKLKLDRNEMVPISGNAATAVAAGLKQREGVENWLDDAELDDDFDTMGEKAGLGMFVKDSRTSPKGSGDSTDQSSSSVKTLTSQIAVSGPYYRLQSVLSHESLPPAAKAKAKAKASCPPRQSRQRSGSNRFSNIPYSDLNIQSVLAISSSDEDSDRETRQKKRISQQSLRGIALTVSTTPDVVGKSNPYPANSSASGSPSQPRNFAKPFRYSPSNSKAPGKSFFQQPSSVHWDVIPNIDQQNPQLALPLPKPNTLANSGSPRQVAHSNSSSVSFPKNIPNSRLSRMMAVSAEEETLLSAMRSKRASMRKAILAEGLTYAIGYGLAAPRPQTADGDKRASSFFEPDMSDFPNPPGAALQLSKAAISSEDLRLLQFDIEQADKEAKAETKPNVEAGERTMSIRQRSIRAASASQPPSRLGSTTSASNLVPSSTTSHGAPLTPPPTVYVARSDGFDNFGSDGQEAADFGHSRKRTLSSVLFLDGVEEMAREREKEEEMVGWAVGERA